MTIELTIETEQELEALMSMAGYNRTIALEVRKKTGMTTAKEMLISDFLGALHMVLTGRHI